MNNRNRLLYMSGQEDDHFNNMSYQFTANDQKEQVFTDAIQTEFYHTAERDSKSNSRKRLTNFKHARDRRKVS
jgi:hypothetical protein